MTKLKNKLYEKFNLENLHYDFMGYEFDSIKDLTYHHIQPKNLAGKTTFENGALLIKTSHGYIHTIESFEFKLFIELSQELKNEHIDGITKEHLLAIRQMLEYFESKYDGQYTRKGLPIIKEEFIRRRIDLGGES